MASLYALVLVLEKQGVQYRPGTVQIMVCGFDMTHTNTWHICYPNSSSRQYVDIGAYRTNLTHTSIGSIMETENLGYLASCVIKR